jgi:alcohol dehydrogenase
MIRAALFDGPGLPFRLECVRRPTLAPGESLARVSRCTICGSDLHTVAGRRVGPTPCVLGHEAVGVIEEMAGAATDVHGSPLRVGDRVVWGVAISCGRCFFCIHGLPQKCQSLRKYGHERASPEHGPLGGLTTHCHLPRGTALVKVPEQLPDAVAAPAGCATATIAAALRVGLRSLPQSPGEPQTVAVIGLGMLGLTACAWIAAAGDAAIACDVDATRLADARRFGAAHATEPAQLLESVRARTDGRGADLALELSGSPVAAKLALDVLRIGGTAVWVGAVYPTAAVCLSPEDVVRRCLTVAGVHNYAPGDLAAAVDFLASSQHRFPFAELTVRTFPLDAVAAAFDFAERERAVRVSVDCS